MLVVSYSDLLPFFDFFFLFSSNTLEEEGEKEDEACTPS